jgi:GT2 family glycosyltransferase
MINFSLLIPTRNRPDLVNRLFQSIVDTTARVDDVEIVLCFDDDDTESHKISDDRLIIRKVVLPKGATMGALNKACFDASTGRYVMLLNDDVILRTKGWDKVVSDIFASFRDDIALIHVNDLLFREKLCTFPMLSRRACLEIGICPTEYKRYRIDDHIYDTYNMLAYLGHKRIVYLPDVIFEHDNYAHGSNAQGQHFKSEDNKVYTPNQEILDLDAGIFDQKISERKQNALKLSALIEQSLYHERKASYQSLLSGIKDSFGYRRADFVKTISLKEYVFQKTPTVTVAVVTSDIYKPHPKKCLSLLKKYTSNFDLIILDNNNSKDFNHPREMNKVMRSIETDFLVLMDDDVFVEEGWLEGLLKCVDAETGMVSPMHKDGQGAFSYSGVYLLGNGTGTHQHHLDRIEKPRETEAACSACILIDMKKCGHLRFNTVYKKYFLDLDFSLQVWEAGYKVMVASESMVTHLGGATMPWSSSSSRTLFSRDENIFVEMWGRSGRLKRLETGIWSQVPFTKFLTEIPLKIEAVIGSADDMEFARFKSGLDDLIENIRPLKLFHAQLTAALQQCRAWSASMGDTRKEAYCQEMFCRFTARKKDLILSTVIKTLRLPIIKLAGLIKANEPLYRFFRAAIALLRSAFDRYQRFPASIRRFTDLPVFKLAKLYEMAVQAAAPLPVSSQQGAFDKAEDEALPEVTRGGTLFICALPPQKIKKHLQEIEANYNNIILLVPENQKKTWPGCPSILYKNAAEKGADLIDVRNVSPSLVCELKARNFDLVIIPYDDPINWGNTSLENFIAIFANKFMILFPNGNKRLYARYDDANRILYNKAYLGSMFRFVPKPRGKKILDIGCSDGLVCDLLLNEDPESVDGIDIMETVGENYRNEKITYHRMDASDLMFQDDSFDLAFSIATLEHCKDPLRVLNEMKRVTKKGGHCYVQVGPLYHSLLVIICSVILIITPGSTCVFRKTKSSNTVG